MLKLTIPQLAGRYGPWALVTGASDGIGHEIAQRLAASGLNVVMVARDASRLAALAGQLAAAHGVKCEPLPMDLSVPGAAVRLDAATAGLDIGLVVAAAGFGNSGALLDADPRVELNMVDLNCRAVLELCLTFGDRLAARGGVRGATPRRGGLVLMSSLLAFQGVPLAANYAATKAYVQTLAEGLHAELAPLGVDVLASAPGPVHTGFARRASMNMGLALQPGVVAEHTLRALGRRAVVRPGWLSWVLEASLAPLPRSLRTRILARVMAGMAAPARTIAAA